MEYVFQRTVKNQVPPLSLSLSLSRNLFLIPDISLLLYFRNSLQDISHIFSRSFPTLVDFSHNIEVSRSLVKDSI